MATHSISGGRFSAKHAAVALVAAGLALGGALAVTSWVADDTAIQAPQQNIGQFVDPNDVRDPSLERLQQQNQQEKRNKQKVSQEKLLQLR